MGECAVGIRAKFRRLFNLKKPFKPQELTDGLGVVHRNLSSSLHDPKFIEAWEVSKRGNQEGWRGNVPDIRYRAYTALWAARHGLSLDGDFVECGVFTGLLSMTICHALNFSQVPKNFYLCDTFNGIPVEGLMGAEREKAIHHNKNYFDVFEIVKRNFSPYPNATLVRGILPGTLANLPINKIAYLSIDLNSASAEILVIKELWDRIVPSAIILLDDYGFKGYSDQHEAWNDFAKSKGAAIYASPTGQGIIVKI